MINLNPKQCGTIAGVLGLMLLTTGRAEIRGLFEKFEKANKEPASGAPTLDLSEAVLLSELWTIAMEGSAKRRAAKNCAEDEIELAAICIALADELENLLTTSARVATT